jgi:putative thiamine transport system ATP-binding protein
MSTLILEDVLLAVEGRTVAGPVTTAIEPGTVVSITGPSGSGKSSLLAFLCGVLPRAFTATGQVLLDGEDMTGWPPERRGLGILFQDDLLFPHLSVAGNLAFGLRSSRASYAERQRMIAAALESFALGGFGARDPATLSGGQRARVSLLRTLLSEPRALLLDEPFAHLDPDTRVTIRSLVFGEVRRRHLPTLLVTHDEEDVIAAGGPVLRLANRGIP